MSYKSLLCYTKKCGYQNDKIYPKGKRLDKDILIT
jgi:hypothetical protein